MRFINMEIGARPRSCRLTDILIKRICPEQDSAVAELVIGSRSRLWISMRPYQFYIYHRRPATPRGRPTWTCTPLPHTPPFINTLTSGHTQDTSGKTSCLKRYKNHTRWNIHTEKARSSVDVPLHTYVYTHFCRSTDTAEGTDALGRAFWRLVSGLFYLMDKSLSVHAATHRKIRSNNTTHLKQQGSEMGSACRPEF